tara:strand:- start:107 stop:325 length:219 start_codon:yes stop_codon:yes gene_type:complete
LTCAKKKEENGKELGLKISRSAHSRSPPENPVVIQAVRSCVKDAVHNQAADHIAVRFVAAKVRARNFQQVLD